MPAVVRPISHMLSAAALMLAVLTGLTAPASGQIGEGTGLTDALSPEFLGRDIVIFVEGLGLDETQRVIVEAMFEDYLDGFEDAQVAMSQRFEQMQEELQNMDQKSVVRVALQPLRSLIDDKASLRDDLLLGVQTVLNEEQLSQWPSFLRRMRREKSMSKGRLDGESMDLFTVLRDMRLPDTVLNQIQPVLDDYEIALDAALHDREDSFQRAQLNLLSSIAENPADISTAEAERQVGLRMRIRDINDEYREQIAVNLPGELGGQFRQIVLERAYPQIYRKTLLQRTLEEAVELEGLAQETLESIFNMQSTYLAELAEINAAMLVELQINQPQEMRERIESYKARLTGVRPDRSTTRNRQSMYQRDDIARPYMEQLEYMLTSEQFAALPQAQRFLERQRRLQRLRDLDQFDTQHRDKPTIRGGNAKSVPDRDKLNDR